MTRYETIRELLLARGEMMSSEIAAALGLTLKQARVSISFARAHGYITQMPIERTGRPGAPEYRWRASAAPIRKPGVGHRFPKDSRRPGRPKRDSVDFSNG